MLVQRSENGRRESRPFSPYIGTALALNDDSTCKSVTNLCLALTGFCRCSIKSRTFRRHLPMLAFREGLSHPLGPRIVHNFCPTQFCLKQVMPRKSDYLTGAQEPKSVLISVRSGLPDLMKT